MVRFRLDSKTPFAEFVHVVNGRATKYVCVRCGKIWALTNTAQEYEDYVRRYGSFNWRCVDCNSCYTLDRNGMVKAGDDAVIEAYIAPEGAIILD